MNMAKSRKRYDKEFKLMVVELSKSREDLTKLAQELEIRAELIYRWRRELLENPEGVFPGNGRPVQTEQEAEIARLKKELKEAQLERDILKKAVSIFSKNDGKYSGS
jgi:transposase